MFVITLSDIIGLSIVALVVVVMIVIVIYTIIAEKVKDRKEERREKVNESKFSPGPWKVEKPDGSNGWYCVKGFLEEACTCYGEKAEANAALIAAAPEMYDVLQHYFDLLEQANNGDAVAECKLFEDIVLIEQALMKARGEA